jgi:hypothetical protein
VIKDVKANISSLMYSTSQTFSLSISQTQVTCDTLYQYDERASWIKDYLIPPFNSTNTFYISGGLNTQVQIKDSSFTQCGLNEDGGVFRIEGKVNFTDSGSTYQDNSAIEGAVISCSGCNVTLSKTTI